jgi:hypothetical protein
MLSEICFRMILLHILLFGSCAANTLKNTTEDSEKDRILMDTLIIQKNIHLFYLYGLYALVGFVIFSMFVVMCGFCCLFL